MELDNASNNEFGFPEKAVARDGMSMKLLVDFGILSGMDHNTTLIVTAESLDNVVGRSSCRSDLSHADLPKSDF